MGTDINFSVSTTSMFANMDTESLKVGTSFKVGAPVEVNSGIEVAKSTSHIYGEDETESYGFS